MFHLEFTEVVVMHCNMINNDYKHNSRVFYKFVPNKLLSPLLDISTKNFILLKTFSSEFSFIEVWFTDENSKPLEIKDKINFTLCVTYRKYLGIIPLNLKIKYL